jgi:hypothetical protein
MKYIHGSYGYGYGIFSWIISNDISEALKFHGYGYGYACKNIHEYP